MYEHFSFRLEGEESWTKIESAMPGSYVSSVENPTPEPKLEYQDIAGASGGIDLTEANGRVFFNNKTVKVVIGVAKSNVKILGMDVEPLSWISMFKSGFSSLNGRRVQFTFMDVDLNEGDVDYQVGRLTFDCNYKEHLVTFTFDEVEPFKYKRPEITKTLTVLANYERDVNTAAWTLGNIAGGGGELDVANDVNGGFVYYDSAAGTVFERIKTASGNNGKYLAFGIVNIVGGDAWFEWTENGKTVKSRTTAKVADGTITMKCSIDGSYYEWRTVGGARKYVPTVRCSYVLSNFLPMSGNELSDAVSMKIPSNVIIRPHVSTYYADGYIICDGVCVATNVSPFENILPRLAIAGNRADLENKTATSVFVVIPKVAGGQPQTTFRFRDAEVF